MRVSKRIKIVQAQFVPLDTARLAKHRSIRVMSASDKVKVSVKRRGMARWRLVRGVHSRDGAVQCCCREISVFKFYLQEKDLLRAVLCGVGLRRTSRSQKLGVNMFVYMMTAKRAGP